MFQNILCHQASKQTIAYGAWETEKKGVLIKHPPGNLIES